ncbi:hypothetical protein XspCFBP7912_17525 [Xanthomonas sp. CFBP 7912]|nr:hypothetical protein XspCFBP7912_17525 [Xanthomonas sp. CFBP 7912]
MSARSSVGSPCGHAARCRPGALRRRHWPLARGCTVAEHGLRRALTKPTQARRLRRAAARIAGRCALSEPLSMSSDSHPRPGSMTQLARA